MDGTGAGPALTSTGCVPIAPSREESRALTGLRGLAAFLVMLHHFYLHLALDRHLPFLQWLLRKGYLGVDLFFVLSGFVLMMVYGAWFDGSRPVEVVGYLRFMARRVARLWPVHATLLVVILVLILGFGLQPVGATPTPRLVVANFAMIQSWGTSAELNTPAWSVSTEFLAYLLFPVLAALVSRSRWGPAVAVVFVVLALAICMATAPPLGLARRGLLDLYFNYSPLPLLRCLSEFTLGTLAWQAGRLARVQAVVGKGWFGPAMLLLFVAAMLGRVNDLVILGVLPLLVLGMHYGKGPVHGLLGGNPIHRIGLLSYAIYLVHFLLLSVFPFGWAPLRFMLPLYLLVTVGVAGLLYGLVEQPGRWLIRAVAESVLSLWVKRA